MVIATRAESENLHPADQEAADGPDVHDPAAASDGAGQEVVGWDPQVDDAHALAKGTQGDGGLHNNNLHDLHDLHDIDTAPVAGKYIGETEKNRTDTGDTSDVHNSQDPQVGDAHSLAKGAQGDGGLHIDRTDTGDISNGHNDGGMVGDGGIFGGFDPNLLETEDSLTSAAGATGDGGIFGDGPVHTNPTNTHDSQTSTAGMTGDGGIFGDSGLDPDLLAGPNLNQQAKPGVDDGDDIFQNQQQSSAGDGDTQQQSGGGLGGATSNSNQQAKPGDNDDADIFGGDVFQNQQQPGASPFGAGGSGSHFDQQDKSGDDDGGDIFQNQQQSGASTAGSNFDQQAHSESHDQPGHESTSYEHSGYEGGASDGDSENVDGDVEASSAASG